MKEEVVVVESFIIPSGLVALRPVLRLASHIRWILVSTTALVTLVDESAVSSISSY